MQRFYGRVISGWPAILLAPIALPVALIAMIPMALWGKKTRNRSAGEVAGYIQDFIDGTGGRWDWDEFESVPITDPELEKIRQEAALAGPKERRSDADFEKLTALVERAKKLV